jgi:Uma2 family endonuclease
VVPDLVIEVLSVTNRGDDLPGGPVWNDCERFGLPASWIVDPEAGTVSQYAHEGTGYGVPTALGPGADLHSPLFPGITLPIAELFRERRAGR